MEVMMNNYEFAAAPVTPQMFGNAGKEHMEKYGKYLIIKFVISLRVMVNTDNKNE